VCAGRVGPVPFDSIAELASKGVLRSDDLLRRDGTEDWIPAASVVGLFPDGPHREAGRRSDDELAGLDDLERWSQGEQSEWFCRMFGNELGPISFDDLKRMVHDEQLAPSDDVRRDDEDWICAGDVPELKAVFARVGHRAQSENSAATTEANSGDEFELNVQHADNAADRLRGPQQRLESRVSLEPPEFNDDAGPAASDSTSDANEPLEDWEEELFGPDEVDAPHETVAASAAAPKAQPAEASNPAAMADSVLRSLVGESPPAPVVAPQPQPVVRAAQLKPRPARRGISIGDLLQGRTRTLVLGGAAAVAVAVVGFVAFRLIFGHTSGESYNRLIDVATQFRELRKKGASDAEFDAFRDTAAKELAPVIKSLERGGSSKSAAQQQLLYASRDLMRMMQDARKEPSLAEQKFDERMEQIKQSRW
jgi:GYF domain 2